jgi:hypothetical protein
LGRNAEFKNVKYSTLNAELSIVIEKAMKKDGRRVDRYG